MKPVSSQLQTLLASRQYIRAKLLQISLADGETRLHYTSGDRDIVSFDIQDDNDLSGFTLINASVSQNAVGLNGKLSAYTVTAPSATGAHLVARTDAPALTLAGSDITMTVFAKAGTVDYMAMTICGASGEAAGTAIFDLRSTGDATNTYTQGSATIVKAVGAPWIGGFMKCIFTVNLPNTVTGSAIQAQFGPSPSSSSSSFTAFKQISYTGTGQTIIVSDSPTIDPWIQQTYSSPVSGPYFERTDSRIKGHWKIGTGSDSITLDIMPGQGTINSVPFLTAARIGMLDGATVRIDYVFMGVYGTVSPGCRVTVFRGRVGEVDIDRNIISMTVNDDRELLNQSMPRELFAASCSNTLYDAKCTVDPSAFDEGGTVASGSTTTSINTTMASATGHFDNGKITFTSGEMQGMTFGVSQYTKGTPGTLIPTAPLPFTPGAGDTFTAFAGCDRTLGSGGCAKFSNTANFRGFPYTPAPETAV